MVDKKQWSLVVGLTLFLVTVSLWGDIYTAGRNMTGCEFIAKTIASFVTLIVASASLDIYSMGPADSFTLTNLLKCYLMTKLRDYRGRRLDIAFEKAWLISAKSQKESLMNILANATKTKYGREKGLEKMKSVKEFRQCHPLTTYETYRGYVDEIVDGKSDVMFSGIPAYLATSSGSTGKHKIFPKSAESLRIFLNAYVVRAFYVCFRLVPRSIKLKKVLSVHTHHEPMVTKSGIQKGPLSSKIILHSPFFTVPKIASLLTDNNASMYVNLVFSMRERDIGLVISVFSSSILSLFKMMELKWTDLCDDIEAGFIRAGYNIPEDSLSLICAHLKPDPERAAQLRNECSKGFRGIAKRIWPSLGTSVTISSGVFKSAHETMTSVYLEGVPNFNRVHAASEGMYGVNKGSFALAPSYVLAVTEHFFELLPVDGWETILPEEAKIGERYELIVTTGEGLYRYRTTDVIEAVGFQGSTLVYNFVQRFGDFLNVQNEKTPVGMIEMALKSVLNEIAEDEIIANYCCTENLHVDKVTDLSSETRYWVFVELASDRILPDNFSQKVDDILMTSLPSYAKHRNNNTASPVKVMQVKVNTFDLLRAYALKVKPETSADQYKTPCVTRDTNILRIFTDNITI